MRIGPEYKIRRIAGEAIIVNQGMANVDMTRIVSLNASACVLLGLAIYNQCSFYLFVGYSVAVLSINLLSYIRFVVVLSSSFGCQKKQKPRHTERSVWLFFVQESKMSFSLRALAT